MKRKLACILAALLLAALPLNAYADGTTTLTTTVPAASYTLNIPADQTIEFGTEEKVIGSLTVTDSSGFAEGKNLNVNISYTPFSCPNVSTTIPFSLSFYDHENDRNLYISDGDSVTFLGNEDGTVTEEPWSEISGKPGSYYTYEKVIILTGSSNWGKALAGEYSAAITFKAEVVVE